MTQTMYISKCKTQVWGIAWHSVYDMFDDYYLLLSV